MSRDQGASRIQTQDSKSKQCIYLQGNRQNSKRVKTVARAQSHQRLSTHSKKFPILWLIPHKASSPFCVREFSSQNLSIRKRQVRASYTVHVIKGQEPTEWSGQVLAGRHGKHSQCFPACSCSRVTFTGQRQV